MAVKTGGFVGFGPAALQFLADLATNNERSWFQPRKAEYEALLKEPMEALVEALAERFMARGIPLIADPRRSVSRIYRDTRFAKDKSPYKTRVYARFPWVGPGGDQDSDDEGAHGSSAYVHVMPGQSYVGGGLWRPERPRLEAFRQALLDDPDGVRAALERPRFVEVFGPVTSHETYKRVPAGFPPDHPLADLARAKDVTFGRSLSDAEVGSPALPDLLVDAYEAAVPVLAFLASLGEPRGAR
jgi:uncharacterized protein (TIGR02453 family)